MNDDYNPSDYEIRQDDTQPSIPVRPVSARSTDLWQWVLGIIIVLTTLSLVISIGLILVTPEAPPPLPSPTPMTVTLMIGGESRQAHTYAATVGEILQQQGITLHSDDYISVPPTAPLTPNMEIVVQQAREVTVVLDGEARTHRTIYDSPHDILNQIGLVLRESDRIWVDGTAATRSSLVTWPVPAHTITIQRAFAIVIWDADAVYRLETNAETVGEALNEAGVTLFLADAVTPDVNMPLAQDMEIVIARALPITIVVDGTPIETRVQPSTVGEAIATADVVLSGLDYTIPNEDEDIFPGMIIRVVRAAENIETAQGLLPYETVYQPDPALELDARRVVQAGENGVQEITYRVRYDDGEEVSRTVESTSVLREPVNEIIAYGTTIVIRTIDTPEGPREYWRVVRMMATSYHPAALGGDSTTATGATLTTGIVASHPEIIPYHTQVFVPGYGIGQMEDTGGGLSSTRRWIDLGYSDEDWVSWRRSVNVYFLTPVPAEINYLLPE